MGTCEAAIRTDSELGPVTWKAEDEIVVLGRQGFYAYRFVAGHPLRGRGA